MNTNVESLSVGTQFIDITLNFAELPYSSKTRLITHASHTTVIVTKH